MLPPNMSHETNSSPSVKKTGRFKTVVAWICGPIVLLQLIALLWVAWFGAKSHSPEKRYVSTARLLAGGANADAPISDEFFATNAEFILSGQVRAQAQKRLEVLHPEVRPQPCQLEASRLPGTRIVAVRAVSPDLTYAQYFLDAAMEEFVRFRRELKNEAADTALTIYTDEALRLGRDLDTGYEEIRTLERRDAGAELDRLKEKVQRVKTAHEELLGRLRKTELERLGVDFVTILEYASTPVLTKPTFSLLNVFKTARNEDPETGLERPARAGVVAAALRGAVESR